VADECLVVQTRSGDARVSAESRGERQAESWQGEARSSMSKNRAYQYPSTGATLFKTTTRVVYQPNDEWRCISCRSVTA